MNLSLKKEAKKRRKSNLYKLLAEMKSTLKEGVDLDEAGRFSCYEGLKILNRIKRNIQRS